MTLSEIKRILAEHDLRLTRSLGQNFMHDGNQLKRIVEAAELSPDDQVLEIGPGLGPLTELLLRKAGGVTAVEKDPRLVAILQGRFDGVKGLDLIHADALDWIRDEPKDWRDWKLVSNLPYSVASPILVELALGDAGPGRIVVTLQQEVAERLGAEAGGRDYGILTLLIGIQYERLRMFPIPSSCFFPEPEVDSACVVLVRRAEPLLNSRLRDGYVRLVKRSFSQRRKMMFKLLKSSWPEAAVRAGFEALGLSLQIRAERVTLEQFVGLTRILYE
jgi:16S rRNA (adenine1518-N6/adenine1519-N6)-dimethyltransferase